MRDLLRPLSRWRRSAIAAVQPECRVCTSRAGTIPGCAALRPSYNCSRDDAGAVRERLGFLSDYARRAPPWWLAILFLLQRGAATGASSYSYQGRRPRCENLAAAGRVYCRQLRLQSARAFEYPTDRISKP